VCTGYRKHPIFIAHEPPKANGTLDQSHEEVRGGGRAISRAALKTSTVKTREPSSERGQSRDAATCVVVLAASVDTKPAVRQQLLEVYLALSLSKQWVSPLQHRVWLMHIPALTQLTPALEAAMMALSLARIGGVHDDEALVHQSLRFYHRALNQLQVALRDPGLVLDDQTLTVCMALGMYEMSQCPNQSKEGYLSHVRGAQKLVQLRGPAAHMEGLSHAIFVHFRIQGVGKVV
jgi:hypothetical protein